jgi:hypothetical protein
VTATTRARYRQSDNARTRIHEGDRQIEGDLQTTRIERERKMLHIKIRAQSLPSVRPCPARPVQTRSHSRVHL